MDAIQGKHFSITDPQGVKTVIYQISKTGKEQLEKLYVPLIKTPYGKYIASLAK